MVEQDYITRLISGNIRTILKLVFHVDTNEEDNIILENEESAQKYIRLTDLINEGKINQAENILIEELDYSDIKQFELALKFYSYLNNVDIDFLEDCNYTKKEIVEGIKDMSKMYGYGGLTTSFLDID